MIPGIRANNWKCPDLPALLVFIDETKWFTSLSRGRNTRISPAGSLLFISYTWLNT